MALSQSQSQAGQATRGVPGQQQQQQHRCYQPPTRVFTDDEKKLMDTLGCIGINDVTRSAFFSMLGLSNMDGLAPSVPR
jgi:hypothetical protein